MSTEKRVQALQDKHAEIEAEIESIEAAPAQVNVAELKKAKLAIKDEISRLQEEISKLAN